MLYTDVIRDTDFNFNLIGVDGHLPAHAFPEARKPRVTSCQYNIGVQRGVKVNRTTQHTVGKRTGT